MILEKTKMHDLLTVNEVSSLMRCSPQKIYYLVRDGELSAVRLGKRGMRFHRDTIKSILGGAPDER